MKRTLPLLLLVLMGFTGQTHAQQASLSGTVYSASDRNPLINANIVVINPRDSSERVGAVTDKKGNFTVNGLQRRAYRVKISYLGFQELDTTITIRGVAESLGKVFLLDSPVPIEAVEIISTLPTVEQKEDTLIYNSRAFKTNPDATAEDLVAKMPGITVDKTGVTAQGQQVQGVKVDGKQFFGNDVSAALRNLPAEMIDKVQVYDELSDQSRLTGFDDGQTQRLMNLITKQAKRNGVFGKVYGGYGSQDRYQAGTTMNYWDGDRRFTLLGLSNNVNQQNFSFQDILGVMGGGGDRGGGFIRQFGGAISAGMRFLGGMGGGRGGGGMFGRGGGGGPLADFFVGQQGGLNTTHSAGLNFNDTWSDKVIVAGSYFFNYGNNSNRTDLQRQYFATSDTTQTYDESSAGSSTNQNHRMNVRMEVTFDTLNSMIIQPRLTVQNSESASLLRGYNTLNQAIALSNTNTGSSSNVDGFTLSNNLVFRHRFFTQGRSFSVSLNTTANNRTGESFMNSTNDFFTGPIKITSTTDQKSDSKTKGYSLSGNAMYTEPLIDDVLLQVSYNASYSDNSNDKKTYQYDSLSGAYSRFDNDLSNVLQSGYLTQSPGLGLRYRHEDWNAQIQLDYQIATLSGTQTFPMNVDLSHNFYTFLPRVEFSWRPSRTDNLNIRYRAGTNAPSVTQLQNVVDNSNPLQLTTGNPNLKQDFSHSLNLRFTHSNSDRTQTLFGFISGGLTDDYIGNTTVFAQSDSLLYGGIVLPRGAQLTYPVNLNGYRTVRSLLAYSLPVSFIQSNLNLSAGFNYMRSPGYISGQPNTASTYNLIPGIVISSNVSEDIDFSLSYMATKNIVKNTLRPDLDYNYFTHNAGVRLNWIFWEGFVFRADFTHQYYTGLGEGYDQDIMLLNLSLAKKFLADNAAEFAFSVNDALDQNKGTSRNVTDSYVEDQLSNVLKRYFVLTFTYNLRGFVQQ